MTRRPRRSRQSNRSQGSIVGDWLQALRGAVTFLTRLPVPRVGSGGGADGAAATDWDAFRSRPWTIPVVGWLVGSLLGLLVFLTSGLPAPTVTVAYLVGIYLLTGINHLDGVADLGDAVVVHGDTERRRAVMTDTTAGVGAVLAVVVVIAGLLMAGLSLAGIPLAVAVAVVIAAEVGAKLGMAAMACFGTAAHDGFGSQLTSATDPSAFVVPTLLSIPVLALTWPQPVAGLALAGGLLGTALPWWWAHRHLEGVSGDVFGAANEIGRILGLHVGVIAWTFW
ncbi:adenosylcobinamide-GDP ribazoletransferase [Natrialbaceae archaeon A-CW1-1]